MLVELKVTNFLSFREKQTFSTVKVQENDCELNETDSNSEEKFELLHSAAVFGANASGKSNFHECFRAIQSMVVHSASELQSGDELPITPFHLDLDLSDVPSEFEISIMLDNNIYCYVLAATNDQIHKESLVVYKDGLEPVTWYSRVRNSSKGNIDWDLSGLEEEDKDIWQRSTRSNSLFLSTSVQLNCQSLLPLFNWFKNNLKVAPLRGWNPYYTEDNFDLLKFPILQILGSGDVGIADIVKVDEIEENVENNSSPIVPKSHKRPYPPDFKKFFSLGLYTVHKNIDGVPFFFNFIQESHGTMKLFSFAGPLWDVLQNGYTMVVDEFNDSFHPKLVHFLVGMFNDPKINKKNAQLIFTTHDSSILNENLLGHDQIWICEKDKYQATLLSSFADIDIDERVKNLESGYLSGRFDGIPFIRSIDFESDQ